MVLNEIVINGGNNGYKLPHMGKDKLMREMGSKIPYRLPCPALLPATAHQSLNGNFVKLWMQQLQAAQALTMLLAPEQPAAEELAVVGEVAVPLLPPVDVDTDGATDDVGEVVCAGPPALAAPHPDIARRRRPHPRRPTAPGATPCSVLGRKSSL